MAQCMFPYHVEREIYHNQADKYVPVPCGKCPECLRRRTASWSFRLEMEALNWPKQFFVTLTYNTEQIPITPNTFLTLEPKHVTDFFKRLRKRAGKLKYYYCGEYGTQRKRPHYHLILFGNKNLHEDDITKSWYNPDTQTPFGDVHFGKVEAASIKYTIQYYDKGEWQRAHQRDDRHPEYSRMSQGIGKSFLTPQMVKHFLNDPSKGYIYNNDGHKIAIPRYYKKRLFDYVGTDQLVANHPSILIHRDEMIQAKEKHHEAISKLMEQMPEIEQTEELNENRRMAIINYRKSKTKTRK